MKLGKLKTEVRIKTNLSTGEVIDANYIAADILPTEYNDISSIENWDKFGLYAVNDYLAIRLEINNLFVDPTKLWANCSITERDLVIKYFIYKDDGLNGADTAKATHLIMIGQATPTTAESFLINSWNRFNEKNIEDLNYRWKFVKAIVLKYLNIADAENLFETVKILLSDMVMIGRLGIGYGLGGDNVNGIMNYVMSDEGFIGTGMEFDGYVLKTGTWSTFKTDVDDILEKGIYDKSIL